MFQHLWAVPTLIFGAALLPIAWAVGIVLATLVLVLWDQHWKSKRDEDLAKKTADKAIREMLDRLT